jgi:hypothetical protein
MYFAIILGIISFLNDVDGLRLYGGIDRMKWNEMDNTIRAIDYLSNPGYDYAIERCISHVSNTHLQQLIYLIDIPETIFISLSRTETFHKELSEVILRREGLKVYLRTKFS